MVWARLTTSLNFWMNTSSGSKKYLKKWEFDATEDAKAFVKEWEAKGRVFDGHEWRKAVKDENGENVKDAEGNTVYEGVFGEDGKIHIQYCPVGEMVVKCVESCSYDGFSGAYHRCLLNG